MFCSNCGTKIADNSKFCMNCGAQIRQSSPAPSVTNTETVYPVQAPVQSAPVQPVQLTQSYQPQTAYKQDPTPAASNSPVYSQPVSQVPQYAAAPVEQAPKKKSKAGLIILAVLLVLALALGGLYYVKSIRPRQTARGYVQKAYNAVETGDMNTALEYVDKAYAMLPNDEEVIKAYKTVYSKDYIQSAYDAMMMDDIDGMLEYADKAYELMPDDEDIVGARDSIYQEAASLCLNKSSELYEAGDLIGAAGYVEKLNEIKSTEESIKLLYTIYYEIVRDEFEKREYDTCIEYAEKLKTFDGVNLEVVDKVISNTYNMWIIDLTMAGDTDEALRVLEEGKSYLSDEDYNNRLAEINGDFSHYEGTSGGSVDPDSIEIKDFNTLSQAIAAYLDQGDYFDAGCLLALYPELITPELESSAKLFVNFSDQFGHQTMEYFDFEPGYYIYYGDMDDNDVRNGKGWIVWTYFEDEGIDNIHIYAYECSWIDGSANGAFNEHVLGGNGFDFALHYSGTLKDFMYDGELIIEDIEGYKYYGTYHDGLPEILGTTEKGGKIVAYTKDQSRYFNFPAETVQNPMGVEIM